MTAGLSVTQHGFPVEKFFLSSRICVGGHSSNGDHEGHQVLTSVFIWHSVFSISREPFNLS